MTAGQDQMSHLSGRLTARPEATPSSGAAIFPGTHPLTLSGGGECLLFVPSRLPADHPAPLIVTLHGAGGTAQGGLAPLLSLAENAGALLLSPGSAGVTWDVVSGGYGADVWFIDRALAEVFARFAIDTSRLAISGFSDGASYALSLGLANGDLFTHIIAYSPGFVTPGARIGSPRVFISHGTGDKVLPIDRCSRRIVPVLRRAHLDVDYHEFDGGHTVPAGIARQSLQWLLDDA